MSNELLSIIIPALASLLGSVVGVLGSAKILT